MAKTETQVIADRYVKALYELAEAAGATDAVAADLNTLANMIAEVHELWALIKNPLLPRKKKAEVLSAILKKGKASDVTLRFVEALAYNQRLVLLPQISKRFASFLADARGILQVHVRSADALSASQLKEVESVLADATGKKIAIETSVDADLISGLVVQIGGVQIDSSAAGKLRRIEKSLHASVNQQAA